MPAWTPQKPQICLQRRCFCGAAVQCASYVRNFALLCKPLHLLLKKDVPYVWGESQQAAFATIGGKLLGGVNLKPPNFNLPLCLLTDASDEGWGAALRQYSCEPCAQEGCQKVTSTMPIGKGARRFFCCDEHFQASSLKFSKLDLENKHRSIISWISKAYPESVKTAPVFYREAYAALTALDKIRIFAHSSKHPVHLFTDHVPLLWVRSTDKGAAAAFLIEKLSDIEYIVHYSEGSSPAHALPDALSRCPCISPDR